MERKQRKSFNLNFIILQGCCLEPQLLEKPLVLAGLVPENNKRKINMELKKTDKW